MPALMSFVKESKETQMSSLSNAKELLERGELPENYTAINMTTYNSKNINIKHPQNNVDIRDESGKTIATFHQSIGKWVLAKGISPDVLPTIGGKETISNQQFEYMSIRAAHANYVSPGYAIIQAQSDLRAQMSMSMKFGADIDDYGYMDTGDLDKLQIDKKAAISRHRQLPQSIRDILSKHEENFKDGDLYAYATTRGSNVEKFKRDGTLIYSTEDIMAMMYKNVGRIPELETQVEAKSTETPTHTNNEIDDR